MLDTTVKDGVQKTSLVSLMQSANVVSEFVADDKLLLLVGHPLFLLQLCHPPREGVVELSSRVLS